MASRSLLIARGWLLQPSHLPLVDTRTKSAGTPTFLIPLFEKEKAANAAFSFVASGKTNVPFFVPQIAFLKSLVSQEKLRSIQNPIANHLPTERRLGADNCNRSSYPSKVRTAQ